MSALLCTQCGAGMSAGAAECTYCGTAYDTRRRGRDGPPQRGHMPDCPRCHQGMRAAKVGRTRVAHCKRCAGLWVPHDSMPDLLNMRKKHARKLHALNRAEKKHRRFARRARPASLQHDVAPARCPACHHAMRLESALRDGSVYLDVCDDHGVWFDQSELRAIVDRHARDTLRRSSRGRREVVVHHHERSDWNAGAAMFLIGSVIEVLGEGFDFFD